MDKLRTIAKPLLGTAVEFVPYGSTIKSAYDKEANRRAKWTALKNDLPDAILIYYTAKKIRREFKKYKTSSLIGQNVIRELLNRMDELRNILFDILSNSKDLNIIADNYIQTILSEREKEEYIRNQRIPLKGQINSMLSGIIDTSDDVSELFSNMLLLARNVASIHITQSKIVSGTRTKTLFEGKLMDTIKTAGSNNKECVQFLKNNDYTDADVNKVAQKFFIFIQSSGSENEKAEVRTMLYAESISPYFMDAISIFYEEYLSQLAQHKKSPINYAKIIDNIYNSADVYSDRLNAVMFHLNNAITNVEYLSRNPRQQATSSDFDFNPRYAMRQTQQKQIESRDLLQFQD